MGFVVLALEVLAIDLWAVSGIWGGLEFARGLLGLRLLFAVLACFVLHRD